MTESGLKAIEAHAGAVFREVPLPRAKVPLPTGSSRETHYIAGFDGMRAIAVLFVLMGHGNLTAHYLRADYPAIYELMSASRGVDIFFVLSGFLITTLLRSEQQRDENIDLRNFFIKRAFRLLPLYYLFIVAIVFMTIMANTGYKWNELYYLVGNVVNFAPVEFRSAMTAHLWSLSVEWHFYLVWPLAFVVLARLGAAAQIGALLAILAINTAVYRYGLQYPKQVDFGWSIPAAIPLITGALAAMVFGGARRVSIYILPIGLALYVLPAVFQTHYPLNIRAAGVALVIVWIYHRQHSHTVRFLEFAPLRFVGIISYGLYVWHGFFMGTGPYRMSGQVWPPNQAVGLVLLMLVAPMSYYGFERPVQALQKKLLRSKNKQTNI